METLDYIPNLELRDGIYFSEKTSAISYPESGNKDCFEIEENSFWFKHRNECILTLINKFSPSSTFFDVGGGNGFVAQHLQANGIKTVLIEPGIQGCVNAKERGLETVVCSTLEEIALKENSIPSIGVFDVVEHIEDDVQFLKSLHKYLTPNGLLYITVPAYQFLWSNEDNDAGHFRRYTINSMEKKLKSIGFSISFSTYIFSLLPLPIFLTRSIPSKLGLNSKSNELQKHKNEHSEKTGPLSTFINRIWNWEIRKMRSNKSIKFGGSVLIVAKKEA